MSIKYSDEFKAVVVYDVLHNKKPLKRVAAEKGVSAKSVRTWVAAAGKREETGVNAGGPLQWQQLQKENEELRKQVQLLLEQREMLKQVARYFASSITA